MGIVNARFLTHRSPVRIEVFGRWDDVMNWAAEYRATFPKDHVQIISAYNYGEREICITLERKRNAFTLVP